MQSDLPELLSHGAHFSVSCYCILLPAHPDGCYPVDSSREPQHELQMKAVICNARSDMLQALSSILPYKLCCAAWLLSN